MVIAEQNNVIEISCQEVVPLPLPTAGDLCLSVRVISHGFAGERSGIWVEAPAYVSFLEQMRALDDRRQGSAEVHAMTPTEFWLRIRAVDRLGHTAVEGRLARLVAGVDARHTLVQAIEFGFEVCPSQLPRILADFERLPSARS